MHSVHPTSSLRNQYPGGKGRKRPVGNTHCNKKKRMGGGAWDIISYHAYRAFGPVRAREKIIQYFFFVLDRIGVMYLLLHSLYKIPTHNYTHTRAFLNFFCYNNREGVCSLLFVWSYLILLEAVEHSCVL